MNTWPIKEWQRAIAENSRDKGWLDDIDPSNPRDIGAQLALIHSEVSEALEDLRDGRMLTSLAPSGKPYGFGTELADIVTRVMCLADAVGVDLESEMVLKHSYNLGRQHRHGGKRL